MHLFIVSEKTLPVHLAYEFAGVTKANDCSWSNVTVNASVDGNLRFDQKIYTGFQAS